MVCQARVAHCGQKVDGVQFGFTAVFTNRVQRGLERIHIAEVAKSGGEDYPSPGWDLILQRVLKIRSSPNRMAVNFPLFEHPVSSG